MQCEAHFATLPSSGRRQQSKSSGLFMAAGREWNLDGVCVTSV